MKNRLFIIFILGLFMTLHGCHEPDELKPSVSREGVNSVIATFADGTGEFVGHIVEGTDNIIIPIPYYYPENSNNQITENHLKRMRVRANLDDNVTVSPSLLYMDLTQENVITVTDQVKNQKEYVVKGEIRKSDKALIEEFTIPSLGLTGIVNQDDQTISLIAVDELDPALAEVRHSHHATIDPDPTTTALDYDDEIQLTVTAHDGVTKRVYTVMKSVPPKVPYGIRQGSAKLLFAKQLKADLGITVDNLTGGMAVTEDYVILNTRDQNSIYLNARTGEKLGEIELGAVRGGLINFYSTADDDGNILINNLTPNAGPEFKVWKVASVTSTPEVIITWHTGGQAMGRKLSIQGSLDSDAIITAPFHGTGIMSFARWTVKGGVLTSQTPEIVTFTGLTKGWSTNADVIYTSATDVTSDYFVASYSDNTFAWVNGATNEVRHKLDEISTNYIPNAVDYVRFNNASYTIVNWVNSFNWGAADGVWLLDVSSDVNFSGRLDNGTVDAVVWESGLDKYGPKAIAPVVVNGNGTGDVALHVASNGYYMYLYFMFTNGYVVGYQFDCIDM